MGKKFWANYLLEGVRRDAIRKSQGKKATEQVYSAIIQLLKLSQVAHKEGVLALEEVKVELENEKLELGLDVISILSMGIDHITSGTANHLIAEILTTQYQVKNPQGMEALACYICIRGIIMIRDTQPTYHLESLLTALLPEECMVEYEKRKEDRIPKQSKSHMEVFLEQEAALPRRSIIIRNVLEEKINQTEESVIKASIQKLDNETAIVLRGLSKSGKKKVLFSMPSIRRNAVLEMEEYMGPIRSIDLEDAMVAFLELIEEAEKENAAGKS